LVREGNRVSARALTLIVLLASLVPAAAQDRVARGKALLIEMCSSCHAVGATGTSPNPAAPPFRIISRRMGIDELYERLREGLSSGHRDMPTFRFSREDARAVRTYLHTIQE
jgi:mono/diheme cytochrome c family protein